jgi:hypothetical protein
LGSLNRHWRYAVDLEMLFISECPTPLFGDKVKTAIRSRAKLDVSMEMIGFGGDAF